MPDRPIALVTGAAKGLGLEIARGLAERGQRVYLSGRSHERARAAAAPLVAAGLDVRPLTLDVEDGPSIEAAATRISREATRLDVLVNNAAVLLDEPYDALDVPLDLVRRTLEVDLVGPWAVLQAFAPLLPGTTMNPWVSRLAMFRSTLPSSRGSKANRLSGLPVVWFSKSVNRKLA